MPHARGKVVGGCTAINSLIFDRGSKEEYDAWAEIGNDGWDWAGLLPSFRASYNYTAMTEGQQIGSGFNISDENTQSREFLGSGGLIQVSNHTLQTL